MATLFRPSREASFLILRSEFAAFDPHAHQLAMRSADSEVIHIFQIFRCAGPEIALRSNSFAVEEFISSCNLSGIVMYVISSDGQILHQEAVTAHCSIFLPFVDYIRAGYIPPYSLSDTYARPAVLAVMTHAYNDLEMLKIWVRHYSRLTDERNLYVIDHGSPARLRDAVGDHAQIVRIPRGEVDHTHISVFCGHFQRFLLTHYAWVIHTDADELLVHEDGPQALVAMLEGDASKRIVRPRVGCSIVHDPAREPALDASRSVFAQRTRLKITTDRKPVLASMPTNWNIGFHQALEDDTVTEEEKLWLVHLHYADVAIFLEKGQRWNSSNYSRETASFVSTYATREDELKDLIAGHLASSEEMPGWMRTYE